jgi:ribose 5-phosphate isomerase B
MRVSVGCDHRGLEVKVHVLELLRQSGNEAIDEGANDAENVDYPDIAARVAEKIAAGEADRGILICGTGIGMAIAANKVPGVRAATCHDEVAAEMSRRHNDTNVLCLSGDLLGQARVDQLVRLWLETPFEGGRHARRVDKIARLESHRSRPPAPE